MATIIQWSMLSRSVALFYTYPESIRCIPSIAPRRDTAILIWQIRQTLVQGKSEFHPRRERSHRSST
ncbi:hypothetical protein [Chroococcidiopsis cubana]|uniref:hypothetical protein n=1 Tax=Chroococcidiopsis cubana TaxID=171392 RepID=UPI000F8CF994|nr:hypothetical protein [Chroococcidiopsis cubana]